MLKPQLAGKLQTVVKHAQFGTEVSGRSLFPTQVRVRECRYSRYVFTVVSIHGTLANQHVRSFIVKHITRFTIRHTYNPVVHRSRLIEESIFYTPSSRDRPYGQELFVASATEFV